jgi:NAD-dependent deacetylase sirtuin 1
MDSFNAGNPRELLTHMIPSYVQIPDTLDNFDICRLIFQMVASEENLPRRKRLLNINSIDNVVSLIKKSNKIMILTGAGCSVSCGIPDFRSRNGIYARLHKDFPDLPDPQSMFDIAYFQHNPRPFFKFAKEIYPGQFKPSLSHLFIKKIEENNKLLRNYTQNIDTIELTADIKNVIQCHGMKNKLI